MAIFSKLDWRRFDTHTIVEHRGIGCVESSQQKSCRAWLEKNKYKITTIDFQDGIENGLRGLENLLGWPENWALSPESQNLDALRDDFAILLKSEHDLVIEILNAEYGYKQSQHFFCGLLGILAEYSLKQLALGRRFFCYLVVEKNSKLVGVKYQDLSIPGPFWTVAKNKGPFEI